jgi:hypothetical protein
MFEYENEFHTFPEIKPAKNFIPDWYKRSERFLGGKPQILPFQNKSLKLCSPFLDSLTSGYMLCTSSDILVEQTPTGPFLTWPNSPDPLNVRNPDNAPELPTPEGFSSTKFVWALHTAIRVPKGYSVLVTHPLNRTDLPFLTLSGVVDTDQSNYILSRGSLPFFMSTTFEGIIPYGTPFAQLIPIKRESWKLRPTKGLFQQSLDIISKSTRVVFGWYRGNGWHKKDYQ